MTSKFFLAATTAGLMLGAAHGAMAADTPKPPRLTPKIASAISEAQTAVVKKDYAAALAAVDKAKAVSSPTPYDSFVINRFATSIHVGLKDLDAADVDAEAAADIDPAVIPDTEKATTYNTAIQLALRAKHYDKAVKYAKVLQAMPTPPDAETQGLIMRALYNGGDVAGASAIAQKSIDAAKAAGKKPEEADLQIIMTQQVKLKDEVGAEASLEQLVAYYNRPDDWNQIMAVSLGTKGMREIDYVYLGRLMLVNGGKVNPGDAQLVGSVANKSGLYGDADAMQKNGGPAADARMAADKKTIPAQIAAEDKQGGEYAVKTAEALYGYGMYPEAEAAARLAQSKGGAKDPTEAPMVIAMSQAAQGKYADAASGFAAITAANPASARVVRLWGYFAKSKASPQAAAAQ